MVAGHKIEKKDDKKMRKRLKKRDAALKNCGASLL
jgi:hypothetical protein